MENENVIEWLSGQDRVTVTFTQRKFVSRIKKLASEHDEVEIIAENPDGSICAHLPLNYIKVSAPRAGNEMSPERKEQMAQILKEAREKRRNKNGD